MGVRGIAVNPVARLSPGSTTSVRMQCAELSRNELDLVLLGQISALLSNNTDTNAHRPSTPRQRSTMAFYHGGVRICRVTFQKLHGIGKIIVHCY